MFRWTQSITAKVLGIGVLALLMLIPLSQADGIVREREAMRTSAVARVAGGWGGVQTIGGFLLAVPARAEVHDSNGRIVSVQDTTHIVLADEMSTTADLAVERRSSGMYEVPVYTSDVTIRGRFLPEDLVHAGEESGTMLSGGKAELRLLIADTRGLQGITAATVDGRPVRLQSSAATMGGYSVLTAPFPVDPTRATPIDFALTLRIAGTESFSALPLARSSTLHLRSAWADPSFAGAMLPGRRSVTAKGFDATWQVMDLNRAYGQHWDAASTDVNNRLADSAMGVKLVKPGSVYQQNDRAGKYGLLFIALTFVAFFLFEVLKGLRLHPVQYLLVGAAMASFYVLLLALSEQIGFGPAYVVAAATVVLIVGGYAAAALRARTAGVVLGGVLALVYAILYGLIGAEQYALLIGSVVLVVVIALLMYLTRRIDWYAYGVPFTSQTETP
ncbi:cell envelope integrity protein CreD [Luteibacter aegosomaticola]|uniref:cell envelope integrity protein CreD n=1 Tax=Luteibacter aegosomaticola TaxID=2911538 RepID=UPI001FF7F856|nr:cell envelope integrity protein CreD [Luteibacter aegosomaticola]UPG89099.1 cell envelope integrity protein CreD [Luteibacter aegosomaticola]